MEVGLDIDAKILVPFEFCRGHELKSHDLVAFRNLLLKLKISRFRHDGIPERPELASQRCPFAAELDRV